MDHFSSALLVSDAWIKLTTLALIGLAEGPFEGRGLRSYRLSRSSGSGEWLDEIRHGIRDDFDGPRLDSDTQSWLTKVTAFLAQPSGRKDFETLLEVSVPLFKLRNDLLQVSEKVRRPTPLHVAQWCVEIRNKTTGHRAFGPDFYRDHTSQVDSAVRWLMQRTPLWSADLLLAVPSETGPETRVLVGSDPTTGGPKQRSKFEVGQVVCAVGEEQWALPPLLWVRPSDSNTFIANGSWRASDKSAEFLCHSIAAEGPGEGSTRRTLPSYASPPVVGGATQSETEGTGKFNSADPILNNLPGAPDDYVPRPKLEEGLRKLLGDTAKRHLVNVKGFGGIGKTSLVLRLCHELKKNDQGPYDQVLWISARDVDLTIRGPKPVRQAAADLRGAWATYGNLWGISDIAVAREQFELALRDSESATLVVLDNFETFQDQEGAYGYLDELVQPPSKVVITSRHDFRGDFQVAVQGMEEPEATRLIRSAARQANREGLMTDAVVDSIFTGCQGHPYAMKIAASNVVHQAGVSSVLSDVLRDDRLLDALFRESARDLTEEADFVFLLVSRFPNGISEPALYLISEPEDLDLSSALQALHQRSLAEFDDERSVYTMPAMAREFAAKRISGHVHSSAVLDAERYIKDVPALVRGDVPGAATALEAKANSGERQLRGRRITDALRLLAEFDGVVWRHLARTLKAMDAPADAIDAAYKRAAEESPSNGPLLLEWSDAVTETDRRVELRVQAVQADPANFRTASLVGRFLVELRSADKWRYDRIRWGSLMSPVIEVLARNQDQLDATDCSRLAWLYLNLGEESPARAIVRQGLAIDPEDDRIRKLASNLRISTE